MHLMHLDLNMNFQIYRTKYKINVWKRKYVKHLIENKQMKTVLSKYFKKPLRYKKKFKPYLN